MRSANLTKSNCESPRPSELGPATPRYIVADLGATHLRVATLGDDLKILSVHAEPTGEDAREQWHNLVKAVASAMDASVRSVGLGIAAPVDKVSRRVRRGGLLALSDRDLSAELAASIGVPVAVENDARLAALAEGRLGAARGSELALTLTIGSGIGGGITIGRELYTGFGGAGEFGHLPVFGDEPCGCGGRGCWEIRASGSALRAVLGGRQAEDVLPEALAGSELARSALTQWCRDFARGLQALRVSFDPAVVVLAGGLGMTASQILLAAARWAPTPTWADERILSRLRPAKFGPQAGLIGAGVMAADLVTATGAVEESGRR